jgi:type IV pilus assembly protein PilB
MESIDEIVVKNGLIAREQILRAREVQKETEEPIEVILNRLGYINMTKEEYLEFLSEKTHIPYVSDIDPNLVNKELINMLGEDVIRKFNSLPVVRAGNTLTVAMADPLDLFKIDRLKFITKCVIEPVLASEIDIVRTIEFYFPRKKKKKKLATATEGDEIKYSKVTSDLNEVVSAENAAQQVPAIKQVDLILIAAIKNNASDIHIECEEDYVRVRFRIDGQLHEIQRLSNKIKSGIISRLKVMGDLDLATSMVPQDGQFVAYYRDRRIDFRLATVPTTQGENGVIRILDQGKAGMRVNQLNFHPEDLRKLKGSLGMANGMVIVSGPTGSGKTTTLYACINEINELTRKIITIEDPVEYKMEIVNQIPIHTERGMTFARTLRSVLRHDPDVVLVGEIRDLETARIAVQASMTGHLLLTTMHTNGTIESIFRLMDMGIEPYYVREVLRVIISQRLVRRLCNICKVARIMPRNEMGDMGPFLTIQEGGGDMVKIYDPVGCDYCRGSGYGGRLSIAEMLFVGPKLRAIISKDATGAQMRKAAVEEGLRTFWKNAAEKLAEGTTSLEELANSYTLEE